MGLTADDFQFIRNLVRERSAIVVDEGKEYLVESRLELLARNEGMSSIDELMSEIRENRFSSRIAKVVESMATRETRFFRDQHLFEALRTQLIPDLIERRKSEMELRIWCAACSSGQEPYSVCMLLQENFPALEDWNVKIFASDISPSMLERTKQAVYSQLEVNRGLPPGMLERFFEKDGFCWRVKAPLREMLTVQELNLAGPWPTLPRFDVVLIRNVLSAFDLDTKHQVISRVRGQLQSGGVMILGGSETMLRVEGEFERVRSRGSWVYRAAS